MPLSRRHRPTAPRPAHDARLRAACALALGVAACTTPAAAALAPTRGVHAGAAVGVAAPRGALPHAHLQALLPTFVRQRTDTSCSVATAATVVNAARAARGAAPLDQADIVASDRSGAWRAATADAAGTGVSLDALAPLLRGAFAACGLTASTTVVHVGPGAADLQQLRATLQMLDGTADGTYVVANFVQSQALPGGEAVGHMSPVAAYDAQADRALVLDVDNAGMAPYWVALPQLQAAMATPDDGRRRGYIVCTLRGAG